MRDPVDRREFLRRSVVALGATAASDALAPVDRGRRLEPIGLQLYTLRDEMKKSVDATLERVATIGYREVEFAGYFGKTAAEISARLKATGLRAPSTHISLDEIRNRWPQTLDFASAVGHDYVVCAYIADGERTADGYRRIADEFNKAAEQAKAHRIAFAYHNHDFEFVPTVVGKETILPYDLLLRQCSPRLVKMELDLYWINKAKQDPLAYFARHPGRFPLVHVKDLGADGKFADVGAGTLPFARYFARSQQAGIRHYFVEHDQPGDGFASVERSYRYLAQLTF